MDLKKGFRVRSLECRSQFYTTNMVQTQMSANLPGVQCQNSRRNNRKKKEPPPRYCYSALLR